MLFLAALVSSSFACSNDETVPEVPVSYRLTLHPTDSSRTPVVLSATIDGRASEGRLSVGMNGSDSTTAMVKCGDTWIVPPGDLRDFPLIPSQPSADENSWPPMEALSISALSLRPTEGGCSGNIAAGVTHTVGDLRTSDELRSGFDCVRDLVGPSFGVADAVSPLNPVGLHRLFADEMLSGVLAASLVDAGGNSIDLLAPVGARDLWEKSGLDVSAALAFGTSYTLTASGTDLGGNTATSSAQFSTVADPGLFAQDGFEGPVSAVQNSVTVIDAAKPSGIPLPAPTGQKALAFVKVWSGTAFSRFTVRMQAPVGATAVKVTYVRYRGQAPDATSPVVTYPESHIVWTVGIPNTNAIAVYDKDQAPVTATPRPWVVEPAAQGVTGWYSDPQTLSFPLPGPASGGEVIFDVFTDKFTSSGDGAFILDDLRVE
jgi:hypothetical protein